MAFNESSLDDYVDVPARIHEFYKRYPEGSIRPADREHPYTIERLPTGNGEQLFIAYTALAFRTPDDPQPGQGTAWEQFPGRTPYTRNSELMNAETSAWGRAIGSLGIGVGGKIASREEVRNRQAERDEENPKSRTAPVDGTGHGARSAQEIADDALKAIKSEEVAPLYYEARDAEKLGDRVVVEREGDADDVQPVPLRGLLMGLKAELEAKEAKAS